MDFFKYDFNYPDSLTPEMFSDGLCLYLVTYEESESQDMKRIDTFMQSLNRIGKPARQLVVFGFGGYDNDPREIYVIEGARTMMQSIISKYPCFGYFINPDSQALFACLLPLQDVLTGEIKSSDAIKVLRQIKDGIRAYGNEIGDPEGAREAIKRWQTVCMP